MSGLNTIVQNKSIEVSGGQMISEVRTSEVQQSTIVTNMDNPFKEGALMNTISDRPVCL